MYQSLEEDTSSLDGERVRRDAQDRPERLDVSCTYLAHHEMESVIIIIIIIIIITIVVVVVVVVVIIIIVEKGVTCWAFWQNWLMVSNMAKTLRPAAPMARWSGWVMSATTSTASGSGRASSGGRLRAL